uniref:acyltransferase family protein n=1 Tax=Bilophila wadsworthia TaxID=35833 RepID=UPI003FED5D51
MMERLKIYMPGIGTWRFFLSFLVAISHLYGNMIHGPAAYAVWFFFVLSGFLMSLVLTKKYGFSPSGLKDYAQNRFLRIYPSYIFSVILGIGVLFVLKRYHFETTVLNPAFQRPGSLYEFIGNFLMIPFAVGGLFVPVASALFVEVWAYALMPFMAYSRHPRLSDHAGGQYPVRNHSGKFSHSVFGVCHGPVGLFRRLLDASLL